MLVMALVMVLVLVLGVVRRSVWGISDRLLRGSESGSRSGSGRRGKITNNKY
jgi:hypothetical protein